VAAPPTAALIAAGLLTAFVLAYLLLLFMAPCVLPPFLSFGVGRCGPQPSTQGRISFVRSNQGSTPNLFVVNPDGSNQQQLTHDIYIDQTAWSPDGKYIAAQGRLNDVAAILRIEVGPDNRAVEILKLTAEDTAESVLPAWSPNGTEIAFQSKRGGGDWQIHVMKPDGSDKRMVTDGKGLAKHPAWSPDGKSIAYVLSDGTSSASEIYVVPVAGGAATKVTGNGSVKLNPAWTNDGKSIVFLQGTGDRDRAIAIVPAEGGEPRNITDPGAIGGVQLSPTEPKLAFYRVLTESEGTDIYTVSLDGGTPVVATPFNPDDYFPAWSPDGKRLTWASSRPATGGQEYKVVVGNPDGTDSKVISTGPGSDYQPQWAAPAK
jgi:TolB protein